MTLTTRPRRPGVTLMEVLIATFILAIGLVAIMALFPLGAVNMARAINQDRSATHGVNSDAMFRYYWKQAWNNPNGGTVWPNSLQAYSASQEPVLAFLGWHQSYPQIPDPTPAPPAVPNPLVPASSQPSFPVLVDPVGFLTNAGNANQQKFVAGVPTLPMRTTLARAGTLPQTIVRLTTLLDDMTFARPGDGSTLALSGEPADYTGQIDRGGRYNCAWLVQRPRNDVPTEANVTVLVYAGRSPTDTPSSETAYPNASLPTPNSILISLPAGQATPNLRRGSWIGLSQIIGSTPAGTAVSPYPTLDFYRVSGINTDTPGQALLDLETPFKFRGVPLNGTTPTAIVFDNLVEVFDRGTVSATGVTGP